MLVGNPLSVMRLVNLAATTRCGSHHAVRSNSFARPLLSMKETTAYMARESRGGRAVMRLVLPHLLPNKDAPMNEHPIDPETGLTSFNVTLSCWNCHEMIVTATPVKPFKCCTCGFDMSSKNIVGNQISAQGGLTHD